MAQARNTLRLVTADRNDVRHRAAGRPIPGNGYLPQFWKAGGRIPAIEVLIRSMPSRPALLAIRVAFALVLGLGSTAAPAHAQTTAGYSLMSWTDADGRALGAVYALAEDRDGYLWLGTDAGLFRFDGARFTGWNQLSDDLLPDGSVTALRVAADGSLWVGFDRAGVRKLSNGRNVPIAGNSRLDKVTDLIEDRQGTMWAVADSGLNRLGPTAGSRCACRGRTSRAACCSPRSWRMEPCGCPRDGACSVMPTIATPSN